MIDIKKITRKIRLDSKLDAIRYQLITELIFLRKHKIIESDLIYISLLGLWGSIPLKNFCNKVVLHLFGEEIIKDAFKYSVRVQTVRNRLNILEKRGFIIKNGKGNKTIMLNPQIPISLENNILLDYNFLYLETNQAQISHTRISETVPTL